MKLVLDFLIFVSGLGILVKIVNLTCPGCGARLEVDMDRKMAFCSYCGAALPIDDEIQKVQLDGAEKAGYEFEKGRQRAQAEAAQASFPSRQACYQPAFQPARYQPTQPQVPSQPQQALCQPAPQAHPYQPTPQDPRRSAKHGCGFWGGFAFSPYRSRLSC